MTPIFPNVPAAGAVALTSPVMPAVAPFDPSVSVVRIPFALTEDANFFNAWLPLPSAPVRPPFRAFVSAVALSSIRLNALAALAAFNALVKF